MAQGCSPEQIAGRLRRAYPDDMGKNLLTETLYTALYVLPRGSLRSELLATLRQARKTRRPRARGRGLRGQIPNMTPITERPADDATRTGPLGRRLTERRPQWLGCGHPGGTDHEARAAGLEGRYGCRQYVPGLHQEAPICACPAAENTDRRSGERDGGPRTGCTPPLNPGLLC